MGQAQYPGLCLYLLGLQLLQVVFVCPCGFLLLHLLEFDNLCLLAQLVFLTNQPLQLFFDFLDLNLTDVSLSLNLGELQLLFFEHRPLVLNESSPLPVLLPQVFQHSLQAAQLFIRDLNLPAYFLGLVLYPLSVADALFDLLLQILDGLNFVVCTRHLRLFLHLQLLRFSLDLLEFLGQPVELLLLLPQHAKLLLQHRDRRVQRADVSRHSFGKKQILLRGRTFDHLLATDLRKAVHLRQQSLFLKVRAQLASIYHQNLRHACQQDRVSSGSRGESNSPSIKLSIIIFTLTIIKKIMRQTDMELERRRRVELRNQERCLNSQPFSRKRAYLSRQKCQQKIVEIEEDPPRLGDTSKIFDEEQGKFKTQQIWKLGRNPNQFDSVKILKQLQNVNVVIRELEQRRNYDSEPRVERKPRTKASYTTRTGSEQSPKSIDSQLHLVKGLRKISKTQACVEPPCQSQASSQQKSFDRHSVANSKLSGDRKMLKIRSNKNMLKVYNPFPTPMAQLF